MLQLNITLRSIGKCEHVVMDLHFALNFLEEALEVGGGGGEYDLVRVEGGPASAGQRHVCEVVIPEYLPGQP